MPNKDVFISYKSDEYAQAIWVKDALETNGISCWMAPMSIPGGSSYASEIENAIKGCRVFVLILSKKAQDSRWVTKELDRALNCGKTIMPFDIDNHPLNDAFNFYLTDVQRYEAYTNKSKAFEKMLNEIRKLLAGGTQAPPPIPQPQPAPQPAPQPTPQPVPMPIAQPASIDVPQDMVIPGVIDENKRRKKKKIIIVSVLSAAAVLLAALIALFVIVMASDSGRVDHPAGVISTADELLNFSFELEGVTYQLPCPYSEFSKNGWEISDADNSTEDDMVEAKYLEYLTLSKDGKTIQVCPFNTSGNAKAIKDCDVGMVYSTIADGTSFRFSNGITLSSSSDEIIAAFGTPYKHYTQDGKDSIEYKINDETNVFIHFARYPEGENYGSSSVEVRYMVYGDIDLAETNTDVPEYLSTYVAPTELGGDINSGVIEIDKKLYRLPAPVSEFVDDGWEITDKPDAIISSGNYNATLKKDGKSISVTLKNLSDYQTVAENCAVISVRIESGVSASLAGGPYIGCSKSLADIVGDEFDVSKLSSYYHYTYSKYDPYIDASFMVDKESQEVTTVNLYRSEWDY
ncbi:MAG: toll/interleukin-1 receptor domain-containing protein [Clostridia bacterium]|nr:toll/interleukin-1 receptor domain-containing protein [Clostridia bacterium]